jgi:hypothetical protein
MAYFIDLFSPETYDAFTKSSREVSGFRARHRGMAERVKPGDTFVCYLTRLSRWFGLLEVLDGPYIDSTPVFVSAHEPDPFTVRFHVQPQVWLPIQQGIPIHEDFIWRRLSFTCELDKNSTAWTGKVRGSLVRLDDKDGDLIANAILEQAKNPKNYPLDENDLRKLRTHVVTRADKVVSVSVPEETDELDLEATAPALEQAEAETRESTRMQALIARIGASMGLSIWVPRNDRAAVLRELNSDGGGFLERLPLNYDDTTLRTIEQIDVLWLRGRAIVRAFEVEHTTSVYSGILRMADLLALQPNMDIKLHIVAPEAKREKVFQEIRRPVFSLLEKGPLAESCTYLSYDGLQELAAQQHLAHLSDTVLEEYAEDAESS